MSRASHQTQPITDFARPHARIPRDLFDRLARIAKERDRTVNYVVLEAICQYLKHEKKRET